MAVLDSWNMYIGWNLMFKHMIWKRERGIRPNSYSWIYSEHMFKQLQSKIKPFKHATITFIAHVQTLSQRSNHSNMCLPVHLQNTMIIPLNASVGRWSQELQTIKGGQKFVVMTSGWIIQNVIIIISIFVILVDHCWDTSQSDKRKQFVGPIIILGRNSKLHVYSTF